VGTSTAPSIAQQAALRSSPAPRYPAAALKQRIALVHPLAKTAGLLNIPNLRMVICYFVLSLWRRCAFSCSSTACFSQRPTPIMNTNVSTVRMMSHVPIVMAKVIVPFGTQARVSRT
jgi:hypothetical protein